MESGFKSYKPREFHYVNVAEKPLGKRGKSVPPATPQRSGSVAPSKLLNKILGTFQAPPLEKLQGQFSRYGIDEKILNRVKGFNELKPIQKYDVLSKIVYLVKKYAKDTHFTKRVTDRLGAVPFEGDVFRVTRDSAMRGRHDEPAKKIESRVKLVKPEMLLEALVQEVSDNSLDDASIDSSREERLRELFLESLFVGDDQSTEGSKAGVGVEASPASTVTAELPKTQEKIVANVEGGIDESDEDVSFEIVPFGSGMVELITYIRDLKESEIDDSKPCPIVLLAALERTGVTADYVDSKTHVVTISQVLKNGQRARESLLPSQVLNFLKGAVALYEDEYASSSRSVHNAETKPTATHTAIAKEAPNQGGEQTWDVKDMRLLNRLEGKDVDVSKRVNPYDLSPTTRGRLSNELNTLPSNEPLVTTQDEALARKGDVAEGLLLGFQSSLPSMKQYRATEAELLRRREELAMLYPPSRMADTPKVSKEIISALDYDVVPLTGEHLSYVMNVSVEDLDVSTHCPPELVEALESIGAQVLDYGDQNADVPLRFLLINAEKKVVELSMNAQEVVTFLKSTLSLPKLDLVPDALPQEPHVIEGAPVDPVVTLEEASSYKTLPLQKYRSYVEGLPIKNMQTNIWPQYLLAALKEVGAKEVTDKKRKVGEPHKFTLPNHSGELIELEMSPIDAAKFLKDELARLRDLENKSIDVTPLPYVAPDAVTPTVPVSPTALERDASTSNVEVVPVSVSQSRSDILERADLEKFEEELKKARNKEQENSVEATPLVATELMASGVSSLKTHEEHKVAEFPSTVMEENDAEPVPVASISMKEKDLHPYEKLVVNQEHDSVIKKRREIQELAQNFDSQFGISAEELTQIEGFDNLTLPQQKLVYENLVQSALGHVKEESLSQYSKEQSAKRAEANNPYGKLIGNVWAGIRSVLTKDFNLIKIEKEIIAKFANGGLLTHRAILEQLVRGVPRVHQDEKTGEILVDLVNMKLDRDNRSAEYEAVRKLNDVAHKFAKIPLAWREDTLGVDGGKEKEWGITKMFKERFSESRKHHLKYEESEKAFNDARGKLELTLKAGGRKDKEIAQILLGVDSRVNQLQFIQTSPDAVAELGNIKDKNIYIQTAKSLFMSGPGFGKSGLGYVALGSVVRTMTASLLGGFAAPVVSSCIAASKSWSKTAAELRERDRNARRGIKDNSEDALNIVSADTLAKKTKLLIDRYNALQEKIPRQLSEGADSADDLRKEIALLEQIKERIAYIHDKQKLNKVDYGARGQSIGKQVELYELLGEATVLVHDWVDPHDEKHVSNRERHIERLIRDTIAHESDIDAKRRSYRMKELAKQAAKAGLFAVAGYLIMDHFKDLSAERAQILKESGEVAPAGSHAVTESVADAAGAHAPAPKSPEVGSVLSREQGSGDLSVKKEASLDNLAEVPKVEALKPYSIKSGDTLTKILKEQLPVIKKIDSPLDKDRALANLFRLLKSDDLNAIGLRSGVADSIYAGETIDLDKLNKIIGEKGGIVRFLRRQ